MADPLTSVHDLELSVRTMEALQRAGIETVGELTQLTRESFVLKVAGGTPSLKDIMRMKPCIGELTDVLKSMGLTWMDHSEGGEPESVREIDIPNMLDEEEFD